MMCGIFIFIYFFVSVNNFSTRIPVPIFTFFESVLDKVGALRNCLVVFFNIWKYQGENVGKMEQFTVMRVILFYKLCQIKIGKDGRYLFNRHLKTDKH